MPKCNTKELEQLLWEMIKSSPRPVKAKILAGQLETSERMIRRLVRDLIAQGNLIASTMEPPYGYFVPRSETQKRRYRNQLTSRIKKIVERLKDFDRAAAAKIEQILLGIEQS